MKYTILFTVVLSLFILNADLKSTKSEWKKFKTEFNKTYTSKEDLKRYKVFKENLRNIEKHNNRFENGNETYLQEINKFADLTDDEFTVLYGLYERSEPVKYTGVTVDIKNDTDSENSTEEYFNWKDQGGFTPAKDQGRCGSCYIFSVVGNVEHFHFRKTGQLVSLSEQHVVDCLSNDTCSGGNPAYVFEFIWLYGIYEESDYPYMEKQNKCLNVSYPLSNATIQSVGVAAGTDDDLKEGLKINGPLTTCFSVTAKWRFYKSGVWYHDECAQVSNHCVLVVGFGRENGNDYWLIKNSWGPSWGDEGYIKMARNKHKNYCGFNAGLYVI